MIKNNYHTHVSYCNHAIGGVIDYVSAAIEFGFDEIGITDHAPILKSFMSEKEYQENWCDENMKMEIVPIYLNDIKEAKRLFGDKISILSGFETEFLPKEIEFYRNLRSMVDYLNLGVHYYEFNGRVLNSYDDVNYNNVKGYVNACIEGMKSGIFNCLVHPDLFMFSYKNINGERKYDEAAIWATHEICKAAIKYNVYLEINANGFKNSVKYGNGEVLYPSLEFWTIAKEYKGLKVIIGADAHDPKFLANENVKKACDFASELGIEICEKMVVNH